MYYVQVARDERERNNYLPELEVAWLKTFTEWP